MLTLTRPQRQILASLAILLLSVVPTGLVAGWAWWTRQPGHVREVEAALAQQLGLAVEIASVRHPGPREDLLSGLVLRLEEPGGSSPQLSEILRADSARLLRRADRWLVEFHNLHLQGDDPLAALARLQTLARHLGRLAPRADLVAASGLVELGRGPRRVSLHFHDLAANVQVSPASALVSSSFRLDGETQSPRCELQLDSSIAESPPRLLLTLQTMDGPIPAHLLTPLFDADAWLGASATLLGTLRVERLSDEPLSAHFQGQVSHLDLSALVQNHFPDHRLSGRADLTLRSASWGRLPGSSASGWQSASGHLSAGPGRIGVTFLQALDRQMRFPVETAVFAQAQAGEVPFQSLGLDFALLESGEITVEGALGADAPPGSILVPLDRLHPLAYAPEGTSNVRGLWKTLVPASDDLLVPATASSQVLHHLPLPLGPSVSSSHRAN